MTTRPSTSAYEHSAGGGGAPSPAKLSVRLAMEQSNTAYSLLSPVFGRLRRSKWLPVKVDRTVYSLEVKLYCKDGLHFPPRAELQTLEQAMLSQGHGAIEADADRADRRIRYRWIVHSILEREDRAGISAAAGTILYTAIHMEEWKFRFDDGRWNWKDHVVSAILEQPKTFESDPSPFFYLYFLGTSLPSDIRKLQKLDIL